MNRCYVTIGGRQLHLRHAGMGGAVLILHPLPFCSSVVMPLGAALAQRGLHAVMPDLPGHGLSDPLGDASPTGDDYAAALAGLVATIVEGPVAIVATGNVAPIAMRLATQLGLRTAALVLDDVFLTLAHEHVAEVDAACPCLRPEQSGAHLVRLWDALRDRHMFRPQHDQRHATRLDRDMAGPAELDRLLVSCLRAGIGYDRAARAAGPTIDLRDASASGPPRLALRDPLTPADRAPRDAVACRPESRADFIAQFLGLAALGKVRLPDREVPEGDGLSRMLVPVGSGHVHVLANLSGAGRPVVAMHDPAGSSALVTSFLTPLKGTRPIIALDMPGAGESDNVLDETPATSASYARAVHATLDALGLETVDLIGRYSGGPVAMEMAIQRLDRVAHVAQAATAAYSVERVESVLASYTPSVSPRADGGHLALAWHMMKNQALFWPWFRQTREGIVKGEPKIDPQLIHQRVFDLLRTGDMYQQAYRAMWLYPMVDRLPQVPVPQLLCAPAWDPILRDMGSLADLAPHARFATLPDAFAQWAPVFAAFFDEGHA